jgi:hypothetical protein
MTNTNCLAGIRCPKCGNEEPFRIEVSTLVLMYDNGSDVCGGDLNFNENSYIECIECGESGIAKQFTFENP